MPARAILSPRHAGQPGTREHTRRCRGLRSAQPYRLLSCLQGLHRPALSPPPPGISPSAVAPPPPALSSAAFDAAAASPLTQEAVLQQGSAPAPQQGAMLAPLPDAPPGLRQVLNYTQTLSLRGEQTTRTSRGVTEHRSCHRHQCTGVLRVPLPRTCQAGRSPWFLHVIRLRDVAAPTS